MSMVGQDTYYYKLTKKIDGENHYTNTAGGQFISFYNDICYDSDKYGISVGNGQLKYEKQYSNSTNTFVGNSYFGNVVYRFSSDYSILNIIVNKNLVYVYKKTTPPEDATTCSLIRNKKNDNSSYGHYVQPYGNSIYNDSYNHQNNSSNKTSNTTSTNKTKVRKKCAYCSGKGETIQHEYVSTFGLDGPRVHCNICNQSWNYGTVHAHHRCSHCNGTGYYEYEY